MTLVTMITYSFCRRPTTLNVNTNEYKIQCRSGFDVGGQSLPLSVLCRSMSLHEQHFGEKIEVDEEEEARDSLCPLWLVAVVR